jgi:hypothetical protein
MAHRGPFRCECGELHDAYDASNDLEPYIDIEGVSCLNEAVAGSCRRVLLPPRRRGEEEIALLSTEGDAELVRAIARSEAPRALRSLRLDVTLTPRPVCAPLFRCLRCCLPRSTRGARACLRARQLIHVPFTVSVKVSALVIRGGPGGAAPARVRAFVNQDGIDFSDVADLTAVQEWDLADGDSELEYPTLRAKFQNVNSITLHVRDNHAADDGTTQTCISYLAFKGEGTANRRGIVDALYEVVPMPHGTGLPAETAGAETF